MPLLLISFLLFKNRAYTKRVETELETLRQAFRTTRTDFEVDITNLKSRDFIHTTDAEEVNINSGSLLICDGLGRPFRLIRLSDTCQ